MAGQAYTLINGLWRSPGRLALAPANANSVETFLAKTEPKAAHRGGSSNWPEETIFAYDNATAWSPSLALEYSFWYSSDAVMVGSHDQTTDRVFNGSYDINVTPWSTLSSLTTLTGGYPITRFEDVVTKYANGNRVIFVENKGGTRMSAFLDYLDANGGPGRFIVKTGLLGTSSQTRARQAKARGYQVWGYIFPTDTMPDLSTLDGFTLIAPQYNETSDRRATLATLGKPIWAHIIGSVANATAARSWGAAGLMVSAVTQVVPQGE